MNNTIAAIAGTISLIATAAPSANAEIVRDGQGLLAPFDNAEVTFEWLSPSTAYSGTFYAAIPNLPGRSTVVFRTDSAEVGDRFTLESTYAAGQNVRIAYRVTSGPTDLFSTGRSNDYQQFRFTEISATETTYVAEVGIDDIRLPGGDADFDDVRIRMRFAQLPSPAGAGLFGVAACLTARRRP